MATIVFLTSRFPFPLNKGDQLRAYFQLKSLAEDHIVHLIALSDRKISAEEENELKQFSINVTVYEYSKISKIVQLVKALFDRRPFQVAYFYNRKIHKKIGEQIELLSPDIVHCNLIRTTEYIKYLNGVPKSLDFMDSFGLGMEKRALQTTNPIKKTVFSIEKNRLYGYEKAVFGFIDRFCIISEQDRKAIKSDKNEIIKIVPNGVDFSQFYARNSQKKYHLIFMGNLSYPPNEQAVFFILHEIVPLLKKSLPEFRLLIAGINASKRMKKNRSENVEIIENFHDISDALSQAKIMLAPMKISIGLQNKIIQAMAMKMPCIVSKKANNAIGASVNAQILEAETTQEFVNHILVLLKDEKKAELIGKNAAEFVQLNYSWELANIKLNQALFNQ